MLSTGWMLGNKVTQVKRVGRRWTLLVYNTEGRNFSPLLIMLWIFAFELWIRTCTRKIPPSCLIVLFLCLFSVRTVAALLYGSLCLRPSLIDLVSGGNGAVNVYQATSIERRFTGTGKYPGVKSFTLHVFFKHLSGARRIKMFLILKFGFIWCTTVLSCSGQRRGV